ncbi:hypothetical protein [Candidatus Mycoplasma haematominutum]|uniref:Uncharacterized protein n=1 Tax=Candidatus Mycoplasma haematominutum 'Birmingham 1' TaxID=1116213 RepID=G8C2Q3_9MOLU|nr:hypothetical protein [Candidatus Mycoplasma haematominutum]CCE66601.1 hypothetical protein MHM_00830 [Candidatus Mycoplasma haematominutum 'Birmingham 1']
MVRSLGGGALTGIGLPTNNAVRSIFNKQEIRKNGWNGAAGQNYENYWYGANGFGDDRNETVSNGNWKNKFESALQQIRASWGKANIGKGLEVGFKSWLEKKNVCKNGSSQNGCYVGKMEFIDNKGETLYGRIPVKDSAGNHNLYVKWQKCTNPKKASAIWKGMKRSQSNGSGSQTSTSTANNSYNWCLQETKKAR